MTDDDIRRQIDLMRAIDKPTVHLPIAVVERLMATGHKVKVGRATVNDGKLKPVAAMPKHRKIATKAKADCVEKGLRANAAKRKGAP
jgi:hypothetical protein